MPFGFMMGRLKTFIVILFVCFPFISCEDKGGETPGGNTLTEYPHLLTETDDGKAAIPEKGSNPIVSFSVSRKPSDRLSSVVWFINDNEISADNAKQTLGKTWDRDDIVHFVTDQFEIKIATRGDVDVMIIAEYESGTVYKPSIKYKNDGKY